MPLPQVNLWAMQEKLTDLGNAIIDRLQTNNAHNNLILGSVDRDGRLTVIARFLLLLATVVACLFLIRRLWRSRKPSDIPPPTNVPAASTGPPGVFDRRQKELLRRDNVLEPVRDLVRDFFTSIGIQGEPVRMPDRCQLTDHAAGGQRAAAGGSVRRKLSSQSKRRSGRVSGARSSSVLSFTQIRAARKRRPTPAAT